MRKVTAASMAALAVGWLVVAGPAAAWTVQEHYTNMTGQTAYDLTKIVWGNPDITTAITTATGGDFDNWTAIPFATPLGGIKAVHWSGGSGVPTNSDAAACFNTADDRWVPVLGAWFTNASGSFIGWAGPVVTPNYYYDGANYVFRIVNQWRSWNGTGYPFQPGDGPGNPMGTITVNELEYATSPTPYTMAELTKDFRNTSGLTWTALASDVPASFDVPLSYYPTAPPDGDYIIFYAWLEATVGGSTREAFDYFQIQHPPTRAAIPALSAGGLIAFGALLVTAMAWALWRRRQPA